MTSVEPPPTSTTADLALDRMAEGLGGADERQAPLLVLAEDLDVDAGHAVDLGHDLVAVCRLADRRGGDRADRLGAELLSEPDLGRDHLGDLVDLLGIDRAVVLRGLVDPRVGALLHHLPKLAVLRLGDEHAGRVGADVYRRAEHYQGICSIFSDRTDGASACPIRPLDQCCTLRRRLRLDEGRLGMRGVLELPEQPRDDEGDLLADVDGVVADPLDRPRDEQHRHRPLAPVGVVADLQRERKHSRLRLSTTSSWRTRSRAISTSRSANAALRLADQRPGSALPIVTRLLDQSSSAGGSWPAIGISLADVHALVAHPLDVLHHVQQRRDQAQVGRHREPASRAGSGSTGGPPGSGRR